MFGIHHVLDAQFFINGTFSLNTVQEEADICHYLKE